MFQRMTYVYDRAAGNDSRTKCNRRGDHYLVLQDAVGSERAWEAYQIMEVRVSRE